jgi:hypothetical protein
MTTQVSLTNLADFVRQQALYSGEEIKSNGDDQRLTEALSVALPKRGRSASVIFRGAKSINR